MEVHHVWSQNGTLSVHFVSCCFFTYLDKEVLRAAVNTWYNSSGAFLQPNPVTLRCSQLCETNSIQRLKRQSGKTGVHLMCQDKLASPQTQQHSNCLVWRLSSCGRTLNGEASSCPAGFSRYFRQWASAHTHSAKEERSASIRWSFKGEQGSVNR